MRVLIAVFLINAPLLSLTGCSVDSNGLARTLLTEEQTSVRAHAPSPVTSLYGLDLNQRLTLPTCGFGPTEPIVAVDQTCLSGDYVHFETSERPDEMLYDFLTVKTDSSGKLQSVMAVLKPDSALHIQTILEVKFGKPDYQPKALRRSSAWFWTYSDLEVNLFGFSDGSGVTMRTTAQRARDDAELEW